MKTVKEIVIEYCKSVGADGLCDPGWGCGCALEDFCCASDFSGRCRPAKFTFCENCSGVTDNCGTEKALDCSGCFRVLEEEVKISGKKE